jgi:peptide/nickel transport system substrate-binding protein
VCFGTDDWDVLMWAQNTLPSGDPVSFLNKIGNEAGSIAKIGGFDPAAATDTKVAAVDAATTHDTRVAAAKEAQAAIKAELPVSNILTPEWHIAISDKMKEMGYHPYGADYYVIRADAPIIGSGAYVDPDAVDSSAMSMSVALALCAALLF